MLTGPEPPELPPDSILPSVPFFAQQAYQCGPAALAMVLEWSGLSIGPDDLVEQVYVPDRKGSLQSGLIGAARRNGRLAYPIQGMDCLLREVAAGHPVIVLQNLGLRWLPRWHYAVVIGYDLPRRQVIVHSGVQAARRLSASTFLRTWQRGESWGLLVLPVEQLPACVQELNYLKAANGLQQSGRPREALEAFRMATGRWPGSSNAPLALGNALYALGDLQGAAQALRRAVAAGPRNAAALNNLAHVLADLRQWDEAREMARRAVAIGGAQMDVYRRTLEAITTAAPE